MSDRCAVQKSFNDLLCNYRVDILPEVESGWQDLSADARDNISRMNNFFCGMHMIVGLANQAVKSLCEWESVHFAGRKVGANTVPSIYDKKECFVQQLVCNATSAFHKRGNEQAGVIADFHAFLDKSDLQLDLHDIKGNREYVLFYNSAGVYALYECMSFFLKDVHGETNLLLKSVSADLAVPELIAEARALGLFCKLLIAPLWRVLEDRQVTIFDMSTIYTSIRDKLTEWAADATDLLDGSGRPFEAVMVPTLDPILNCLTQPAPTDNVTLAVLQVLCSTFARYMSELLADHLPGGKFHQATPDMERETASVHSTNVLSERDFAQLDRLLWEKPNASTIAVDGMIAFSNNKTGAWLSALTPEDRSQVLDIGRKTAPPLLRDLCRDRKAEIKAFRVKEIERKEAEVKRRREKVLEKKESLTQEISQTGGLWLTPDQVRTAVASLPSVNAQCSALRAQLFFRKLVLEQNASADVFLLSKAGKQRSIECLVANLSTLLHQPSPSPDSDPACAEPLAKRVP